MLKFHVTLIDLVEKLSGIVRQTINCGYICFPDASAPYYGN